MIVSRRSSRIENDLLEYRNFFSVGPSLLQLRFLAQMIESFPPAYSSRTAAAKKCCRSLCTRISSKALPKAVIFQFRHLAQLSESFPMAYRSWSYFEEMVLFCPYTHALRLSIEPYPYQSLLFRKLIFLSDVLSC